MSQFISPFIPLSISSLNESFLNAPGSGSLRHSSERQAKSSYCEAYILSSYGKIHRIVCCKGGCVAGEDGRELAGRMESSYVCVDVGREGNPPRPRVQSLVWGVFANLRR